MLAKNQLHAQVPLFRILQAAHPTQTTAWLKNQSKTDDKRLICVTFTLISGIEGATRLPSVPFSGLVQVILFQITAAAVTRRDLMHLQG